MNEFLGGSLVWFWTTILLHFVWQGVAVAASVALLLLAVRRSESAKRYGLLVVGLLCMVAFPVATCAIHLNGLSEATKLESAIASYVQSPLTKPANFSRTHFDDPSLSSRSTDGLRSDFVFSDPGESLDRAKIEGTLRGIAFVVWLVVQMLLGGRLFVGALIMWRIRHTAEVAAERVQGIGLSIGRKLGLRKMPGILVSHRIADAATVGFFHTVVILPATWLTQMSPEMLEAVLAHEFAHVRRHDAWVNLLQRIVEIVFFYHPAVWWLSAQIRMEREHCCDSSAIQATGDCNTFARTLELAARQRAGIEFGLVTNLGGKRMSLLNRINRVLGQPQNDTRGTRWPLGLATLLIPVLLALHAKQETTVAADPQVQPSIRYDDVEVYTNPVVEKPTGEITVNPTAIPATATGFPVGGIATQEPPTELRKVTLPDYVIEPPDILHIEGIKLTPKGPQRIEEQDVLQIVVRGTVPDSPIAGQYLVEGNGRVTLGPGYGTVELTGLTTNEAAEAIAKHLREFIKSPEVAVVIFQKTGTQSISGEHLVAPDGTVNLGIHGRVFLSGKTVQEAREAVEKHLSKFYAKPRVSLNVFVYNSKFYYIITEGREDQGDQVVRIPVSGNETVLDAIAQIGGLDGTLRKIWISRPSNGKDVILKVDFQSITRGAATKTNYQLLPGDRLFISKEMPEDFEPQEIDEVATKFNKLVKSRQFAKAIELARSSAEQQPDHPVVQNMLMHANLLEENVSYRTKIDAESTANFIEELRQSRLKEIAIERALGTMIEVDLSDVPLEAAMKSLGEKVNIDIVLDNEGLTAEGVTRDVPVTLQLRQKISLRNALRLILEQHRLKAGIHASVLRVTTRAALDPVYVQSYRIRDLVGLPTRTPGETEIRELDSDDLLKLITNVIAPNTWTAVGGPGAIQKSPRGDSLIISNSRDVHQQITELLRQLRTRSQAIRAESMNAKPPSPYQRFPDRF